MIRLSPKTIPMAGFILMILGVVLPFLMVIRVLEAAFLLSFVAFASQTIGLLLGMLGLIFYAGVKKR